MLTATVIVLGERRCAVHIEQVLPEFLVAELIRGSSVMAGQPINGADIVGLGVRREPALPEFIHEFLKQCSHGDRIVHRGIQQGQNTAKLGAVLTLFMA